MNAGEPFRYAQCGLRLCSELELHLPALADDGCDVDIRWGADIEDSAEPPPGEVIAEYQTADTAWYTATSTAAEYRLRFRNCGEFVLSADLSEVSVRRDPNGRTELLPILMAGTVSAFLLALRGETVLHASAVAVDGRALAFVGQSGRGKSTIAALLCVDGADLVTDDVLTVEPGPPVTCRGSASELRLRAGAVSIAESTPDASTRATADQRLALASDHAPLEPIPLAAIVIPAPSRTATRVEIRREPATSALFGILSFPRIHGWRRPDVLSRDFTTLSQVVNAVPVYNVTIPWGPPFSPAVAGELASLATG